MNKPTKLLITLAALQGIAGAAPVSITSSTLTYTQSFDTLPTATAAWTNDSTIPGWFAQINNVNPFSGNAQVSDGTGTALTGLLNLGATATTDRALGSKATGTGNVANIAYAVSFQNNSTKPVSLSELKYTGELWRTNTGSGTPAAAVNERYTVFYQISSAPVTNILSGGSSATAAAGAGFTALGATANWISPVNSPLDTPLDGNASANRSTVTVNPANVVILPGQYLMVKWTDVNEAGTDGYQAIDDVSVSFTELNGLITATTTLPTRNSLGTPDPADDTFGFSAAVTASGSTGASWTTSDVIAPNATGAAYGSTVVWTGFPVTAPKSVTFTDIGGVFTTSATVEAPKIIGANPFAASNPIIINDGQPLNVWTVDETAQTQTLTAAPAQGDRIIDSQVIDLSSTGFVEIRGTLDAIAGSSSGFEAGDSFTIQAIIDGGAPVSILGAADTNSDGRLTGAASAGTELPDATITNATTSFSFAYLVPATANTLQIRIIGNSNSPSETFLVKNLALATPPPALLASPTGTVTVNNQGTDPAADDTFSGPVNVYGVSLGASTGWTSDATPASGLYSAVNPVTFGDYLVSGGAKTVTLADVIAPAFTSSFTLTPPAPILTVGTPANIVRLENGPGIADDTVSFEVTITGTNGGPRWTATGAATGTGNFGTVTMVVSAAVSPAVVTVSDISYPAVTQNVSVTLPARYVIGQRYNGSTATDILSPIGVEPAAAWVNNAAVRTLDMITGGTSEKVVLSDVIDLSAPHGSIHFSGLFRARETSVGSNFETLDKFKAELLINGGLVPEDIINLVDPYDNGDGASATAVATSGLLGPKDGYINGYQPTAALDLISNIDYAVAPLTAEDEYNANRSRDEFNRSGQIADDLINNVFPLSYTIPSTATSVQLRISGSGISGSEFFTVSNVVFSSVAPSADTDGDGVTDVQELADGTNPADRTSVFTVTDIVTGAGGAQVVSFPTVTGRVYRGYTSTDLVTWTRDDSVAVVAGNGNPQTWTLPVLPAPAGRNFLKVAVGLTANDFPAILP